MSFEDYAYVEHTLTIRQNTDKEIGIITGFTAAHLAELFRLTQDDLLLHPYAAMDAKNISVSPFVEDLMAGQKLGGPIIASSAQSLVAIYCTLGQAAKSGRQIEAQFQSGVAQGVAEQPRVAGGPLGAPLFLNFEDDILLGARSFWNAVHVRLEAPDRIAVWAFVKSLSARNG